MGDELAVHRVERVTRIELALSAWEADVLPLNYTRSGTGARVTCRLHPCPDIVPDIWARPLTGAAGQRGRSDAAQLVARDAGAGYRAERSTAAATLQSTASGAGLAASTFVTILL